MEHKDLRDLLKSGYDTHTGLLRSGEEFTKRHHGHVARAVGRRRVVRQTAIAGGAIASVSALTVGGAALADSTWPTSVGALSSPTVPRAGESLAPTPASSSPSPSPNAASASGLPEWAAPLPEGAPQGEVVDNAVLRLVLDAQAPAPATPSSPPTSVACGAPAAAYVAPMFVDASARILRPDTVYPTYAGPDYVPQPNDGLLALGLNSSSPAEAFFVAVSTLDHESALAWKYDEASDTWSGGASADYHAIAQQGVLAPDSSAVFATDDVDFLYGTVVVKDGVVVGHADLWSPEEAARNELTTALSTVNEVTARDETTALLYDYAVGPLESVLWCSGAAPTGTVDTYAVVGTRLPGVEAFDYTMLWAGAVEYR